MPRARKVVIECPKYTYTKVVTRGNYLPDASMFLICTKSNERIKDSENASRKY